MTNSRKKARLSCTNQQIKSDPFEKLPDDIVISIFSKLSSSSSSPSDFISALFVCKKFNQLGLNQAVLSNACPGVFAMKATNWCESAHRFLKLCVHAGSTEASYFLGMVRFYCMEKRVSGVSLMAKAAIRYHAAALYSLAVIQFNGSGGAKRDKDIRAGVALCARAAYLDHVDALRELGHCLQDGYGVKRNIQEGCRLLIQANARELACVLPSTKSSLLPCLIDFGVLSEFGCNVPSLDLHPVNRFMVEWFGLRNVGSGLRLCSYAGCGRPETRAHEFRRCSVCGSVNYCSRGCQALDWKLRHKMQCCRMGRDDPQFGLVVDAQLNDDHHQVAS